MCNNLATIGCHLQFQRENNLEGYSMLGIFTWLATCSGLSLSLSLSYLFKVERNKLNLSHFVSAYFSLIFTLLSSLDLLISS